INNHFAQRSLANLVTFGNHMANTFPLLHIVQQNGLTAIMFPTLVEHAPSLASAICHLQRYTTVSVSNVTRPRAPSRYPEYDVSDPHAHHRLDRMIARHPLG
ncbi:hypothetical protein JI435_424410, partial [Parastagonospora nodorum SN15]